MPIPLRIPPVLVAAVLAVLVLAPPLHAGSATFSESGFSNEGNPLSVQAILTGSGTMLTLELINVGPKSVKASDILTSFYFNITNPLTGISPMLTYASGSGQAYTVTTSGTDQPVSWTPQTLTGTSMALSNLVAIDPGDQGWQFKSFIPAVLVSPTASVMAGFGIGTVGNSGLTPQGINFNGNVVSGNDPGRTMINLGIYSNGGDGSIVATDGIIDNFLVRNRATFTFSSGTTSLDSFDTTWVPESVAWGFGTNPDTLFLPEPAGVLLAAAGAGGLALAGNRFSRRRPRCRA